MRLFDVRKVAKSLAIFNLSKPHFLFSRSEFNQQKFKNYAQIERKKIVHPEVYYVGEVDLIL